ncbi:uncharacterized protein EI97DRAFT_465128 [Westerdykella ornata]|uniref:Uncharacterized protein n=1 Tax=Westerdykella ornata TaxID=318751 RepID=A0A6A6JRG9_WESOR|nr:uncharacterized protein EI97DRAFT_465128 [Westerdykella ornata]KAF2278713.1 hypothetical protein EI97DRAFT_465128 [Westerdykella ornata]
MQLKFLFLSALPTLALAQGSPGSPDFYNTVADIFSGRNCDAATFVWADPIFGTGGTCQLLDRNNNTPDIYSYRITSQYPGCSVNLYVTDDCSGTAFPASVGECVSAPQGTPFVRAFVQCPFS